MPEPWPTFDDAAILDARPAKAVVDTENPYAYLVEPECTADGRVEDVATVFLTNRECPFRCLMCDLWKHTTDRTVPAGSIPAQLDYALARLPATKHIKLYNSGNFFDGKAIPQADWPAIAERVGHFETVIVENHPRLCNDACLTFRDMLNGQLEIAMGLETIHPEVLPRLNKRMTADDFQRAAGFLAKHRITSRAFILLRPPFLTEEEGVEWALRSIDFAFDAGVGCCAVIPTRHGNGMLQQLTEQGYFTPPTLTSLEYVLKQGLAMGRGRVLADLWDLEHFFDCNLCGPARKDRLHQMNLTQDLVPPVSCEYC